MSHPDETDEARLVEILAGMRVVQTREADFEERFLFDFHERVSQGVVCCSARHRLLEHVHQLLCNFGMRRLAYGASTLGIGALAFGTYMVYPTDSADASATTMNSFERGISRLTPGLARDLSSCTSAGVSEDADGVSSEPVLIIRRPNMRRHRNTLSGFGYGATWGSAPAAESDSFADSSSYAVPAGYAPF